MTEIWKDIKYFEGHYQVSSLGKVRSVDKYVHDGKGRTALKKSTILRAGTSNRGYKRVLLSMAPLRMNMPVHRLVAIAFIPNPNNYPQVNHINGNKGDNSVSNLEWCDQTYNNRHARANKLNVAKRGKENHSYGFNNHQSFRAKNNITGEIKPIVEIAKEYPYTRRHVTMMLKGERTNKTNYSLIA